MNVGIHSRQIHIAPLFLFCCLAASGFCLDKKTLEELVTENSHSILSLSVEYSVTLEVNYSRVQDQLKTSPEYIDGRYQFAVEHGKVFFSRPRQGSAETEWAPHIMKRAFNGRSEFASIRRAASEEGENSVSTTNFLFSRYSGLQNHLFSLGIEVETIFGSFDGDSTGHLGNNSTAFHAFNRSNRGMGSGFLQLSEAQHKGMDCVLLEYVIRLPEGMAHPKTGRALDTNSVMARYFLDPKVNYSPVLTRLLEPGEGVLQEYEVEYIGLRNGIAIPKTAKIRKTVGYFQHAAEGEFDYPQEDWNKIATTMNLEFSKFEANQDIPPETYEASNVFIPGSEIWDLDAKRVMFPSARREHATILANLKNFSLEEPAGEQPGRIPEHVNAPTLVSTPATTAGAESEASREQKPSNAIPMRAALAGGALLIALIIIGINYRRKLFLVLFLVSLGAIQAQAGVDVRPLEDGPLSYSLGLMDPDQQAMELEFRICNTVADELQILKTRPKCQCTAVSFPQDRVTSGGTFTLTRRSPRRDLWKFPFMWYW